MKEKYTHIVDHLQTKKHSIGEKVCDKSSPLVLLALLAPGQTRLIDREYMGLTSKARRKTKGCEKRCKFSVSIY